MKIKQIHLKNYKRFYDLTINLGEKPKKIVALVGPNGCGKSSIFDAFLFLQNSYYQIGSTSLKNLEYHTLKYQANYSYENIKILFDEGEYNDILNEKTKDGKQRTIFSFRSAFRYNGDLKVQESHAIPNILENNTGASVATDIDQRMEENYRRLNVIYNRYLHDNDVKPSQAKAHIIGELNAAIQKCLDLQIDNMGDIADSKGTIFFRKKDSENTFEYNVLSAGEKEVVDILLDLYLRRETYNDTIYIIDEPELHINTAIQRKLIVEIDKFIPDNCQIWIATHSIGFLRSLQEELNDKSQIIEFEGDKEWASKSYELKPIIKSRSNWIRIFSTALDDLNVLVCPKRIVYCEGRAEPKENGEERGFDAKVYNMIFGKKYADTLFVSSGGNTELDKRSDVAIKILSKIISGIEILVLKDLDMNSGNEVNLEVRKQYLDNNPKYHRVLSRFEIENYLYDKEVLEKFCKNNCNIYKFDINLYNKYINDITMQNVKDLTMEIKKCCGIQTSISQEKFKINLASVITPDMQIYKQLEKDIFQVD